MDLIFFLFPFLLFFVLLGAALYQVIKRARELPHLVKDGVETQGRIIGKRPSFRRRRANPSIRYEFQDAMGRTYQRKSYVPHSLYEKLKVGDPFDIVYLPQNPRVSAGKYLVDQVRSVSHAK